MVSHPRPGSSALFVFHPAFQESQEDKGRKGNGLAGVRSVRKAVWLNTSCLSVCCVFHVAEPQAAERWERVCSTATKPLDDRYIRGVCIYVFIYSIFVLFLHSSLNICSWAGRRQGAGLKGHLVWPRLVIVLTAFLRSLKNRSEGDLYSWSSSSPFG